jgi:murein DD-endopeptidase MepM/ murein hydrolase activator NlpD
MTQQVGDHEVVRVRPFVRLVTNLAASTGVYATDIPPFDASRLFDQTDEPDRTAEASEPEESDAAVTIVRSDISRETFSDDAPAMSDDEMTSLVATEQQLTETASQGPLLMPAGQHLLQQALSIGRTGDTADGAESLRADDPFHAIEVRVVPENVTNLARSETAESSLTESRDVTLGHNQTLSALLQRNGADDGTIHSILAALSEHARNGLPEGQHLNLFFAPGARPGETRQLRRVTLFGSDGIEEIVAAKDSGDFVSVAPPSQAASKPGEDSGGDADDGAHLYDSLYETILKNGLPRVFAERVVGIFGLGIDLQRAVEPGDKLELFYTPADNIEQSDILYASLTLDGEKHRAFRFELPDSGGADYFDQDGGSLRKFLLRKPIAEGRITSPFGMRYHPILHYGKFHNGVDWADKAGTPIHATGDGTVVYAGPRSGYGNRVELQHANGYNTAYNHMLRIARGVVQGSRVHQGQVIGFMGSTGLSTGPHVHYEVSINGHFVDPLKIRLPSGRSLSGATLAAFKHQQDVLTKIRHDSTVLAAASRL